MELPAAIIVMILGAISFFIMINIINSAIDESINQEKLQQIKDYRCIRDEILSTDNTGRARKLLLDLPNVEKLEHYVTGDYIKVTFSGGYEYDFGGYEEELYYIRKAAIKAYFNFIEK